MENVKFRGLTIGNPTSPIRIIGAEGFDDYDSNSEIHSPDWLHGGWPTGGFMPSRELTLDVRLDGKWGNVRLALRAVKQAFKPSPTGVEEFPLEFTDANGGTWLSYVRCVGRKFAMTPDFRDRMEGSVRLLASDPRLYSADERVRAVNVWTDEGGTDWVGLTWPFSWQPGASSEVAVSNHGTIGTWPRFVVTGPTSGTLSNPRIENLGDGSALDFSADGGLTINAGQSLEVETLPAQRDIRLNDITRWNNLKEGSKFAELEPGDNSFRLRANGDVEGAQLHIYWRHAEL